MKKLYIITLIALHSGTMSGAADTPAPTTPGLKDRFWSGCQYVWTNRGRTAAVLLGLGLAATAAWYFYNRPSEEQLRATERIRGTEDELLSRLIATVTNPHKTTYEKTEIENLLTAFYNKYTGAVNSNAGIENLIETLKNDIALANTFDPSRLPAKKDALAHFANSWITLNLKPVTRVLGARVRLQFPPTETYDNSTNVKEITTMVLNALKQQYQITPFQKGQIQSAAKMVRYPAIRTATIEWTQQLK